MGHASEVVSNCKWLTIFVYGIAQLSNVADAFVASLRLSVAQAKKKESFAQFKNQKIKSIECEMKSKWICDKWILREHKWNFQRMK